MLEISVEFGLPDYPEQANRRIDPSACELTEEMSVEEMKAEIEAT